MVALELNEFQRLEENDLKISAVKKDKFLDLIDSYKAEECYTKILHKLFKQDPNLIKTFIENHVNPTSGQHYNVRNEQFHSLTEVVVPYGRIDNFAYSDNYALIIENKIDAEFTMRRENGVPISQLKRYQRWANGNNKFENENGIEEEIAPKQKIYVILAPDCRYEHIKNREQVLRESEIFEQYCVIKYSQLYELIEGWESQDFVFNRYLDDIKLLIYRLSLKQNDLYTAKLSEQLYSRGL